MHAHLRRDIRSGRIARRVVAAAMLLVLIGLGACAGSDSGDAQSGGDGAAYEAEQDELRVAEGSSGGSGSGSSSGGGSSDGGGSGAAGDVTAATGELASGGAARIGGAAARLPRVGPSVIKTATVRIGVAEKKLSGVTNEAISVAGRYGGFVLTSHLKRGGEGGTLTMRIPAERFEVALADLEGLGTVQSETISGEDVGQQFVDLEARLRNWEAQEAVLLRLMDRAESVTDTIKVQSELSRIQLEIEQIRGRLRFLRDQTSLGTITATFAPLTPKPDAPNRFAKAWSRAVELMQSFVSGLIVTTGVLVPLAVIALIGYVIFRGVKPRFSG